MSLVINIFDEMIKDESCIIVESEKITINAHTDTGATSYYIVKNTGKNCEYIHNKEYLHMRQLIHPYNPNTPKKATV